MKRTVAFWVAAVIAVGVASQARAAAPPSGVGPNGENGGFKAKFVDVEGVRTRFYEEGAGEPMVLVHGSGFAGTASANTWVPVVGLFAKKYHVYAPDKLASGMTDNPKNDDDLNIRGEVEHIANFIKTMKLGKVHLVGQSRGGGCVFLLAVNHPELVKTLVIVDSATAAPSAGDDRANRRKNLLEHCPKQPATALWPCQQAALLYNRSVVTKDFSDAATFMENQPKAQVTVKRLTRALRDQQGRIETKMIYDAYRRLDDEAVLQMPVLIFWGKNDPSVLPIQGEQLFNFIAENNPHARLRYMNRAGHFHYREHPEEFAHTVTDFIEYWNTPAGMKELETGKAQGYVAHPSGVGPSGENGGFKAKFVDVEGIRTRYYEEGAGDPMVLVHGSGFAGTASANTWVPVLGHLAKTFHVFAPDKLASGMTDNPKSDADLNIRGEMEHVANFIKTLKLGKVHLIGQSRGGGLVFLMSVYHPELVRTVVIVDSETASPPAGDDYDNRRKNLLEHCPKTPATALWPCQQAALLYNRSVVTSDFIDAATFMEGQPKAQETVRRVTRAVARENTRITEEMDYEAYRRIDAESALQVPALLFWGKNDPSVLPMNAETLFNIIAETDPYARLEFINKAGHFHYREHPDEFAHTVTSFISYWNGPGAKELAAPAMAR